jgi:hypothetical protein
MRAQKKAISLIDWHYFFASGFFASFLTFLFFLSFFLLLSPLPMAFSF